ncbi:MAG: TonB-dependent receptor [Acidobacteria bacterium]|nr:TonB-dependent receptor [Acidobacteriota bacterium]MYI95448.1 TonB-dependent receptor [Acidobacteriota bacterium]
MSQVRVAVAVFATLGWAASSWAFSGRVLLESGEPAAGAIVQILGHPGSAVTDGDGRFEWLPDPAPPFHVLVVLPGDRYTSPVFVPSLDGSPVEIEVEALEISESVTITSGAVPHTEATPGSAPAVISGEAIRTRQAPRLIDVLEAVPGGGRSSDLHAGVPSIRGLSRGRTVLLLDGARITTERRAGASASFLDPFFLETVEVVRGPSSVAYGSDAFGGVIHARTRRPIPGGPVGARARGTLGTGLPEASLGAEIQGSALGTGFLAQARRRVFSAYSSPEGEVEGSGAEDYGMLLRAARDLGGGHLGVALQYDAGRNVGRPRRSSAYTSYPDEDSLRLVTDYQFAPRWGFARLDTTAFVGAHRLVTRREEGGSAVDSEVAAHDFMLRGRGIRPFGAGRLELGTEVLSRFGIYSETRGGPDDPILNATAGRSGLDGALRREASVYGHAETPLAPRLAGSAGARLSAVSTESGPTHGGLRQSTNHGALSGFFALRADLWSGVALTGQLSRGFRDPTLSDRYYAGLSGRGIVFGNPDLTPERSLQSDLSLRYDGDGVHGGLYAYRYRISDLIERYEEGEDFYFFRNRGEATLSGVEFEVQVGTPTAPFLLDLSAGLTHGMTDEGAALDGVPPANFRAGLRRRLPARSFAEVVLLAFAADRDPGPTESVLDAYARLDAAFGFPITGGAELRLSGRNLLNAAYPISADSRAVLAPGRSLVGTIVWNLGASSGP